MEVSLRKGLNLEVRLSPFQHGKLTEQEARSIGYLFKVKRDLFTKNLGVFELNMSDRNYYVVLRFKAPYYI